MLAEVYLPLPLNQTYTYRIKEGETKFGCRVSVFFGKRKLVGYVVKVLDDYPLDFEVKDIIKSIDKEPILPLDYLVQQSG